jgi:tetratricopeptide (TPR) repeat protein
MKQTSPNTKQHGFPPLSGLPGLFPQERGGGMQQPRTTQELARQMQGVTRTSRGFQSLLPDIRALRTQLVARGDRAGLSDLAEKIRLWAPGERAPAVTARVLAEAADVFGDAEQWERAAQLLERAVQANPLDESVLDRASATMLRGGAFEELHDVLTAHAHLLDRQTPEDTNARSNAWLRVGRIRAERLRNIDAAIAAYDTAIQIEPDVTALRELSALLETRGRPDDRDSAADLYCLIGELLGGDQGAVYYARALNLNPRHPEALAQLGEPGRGAAPAPYTPAPYVPRVSQPAPQARPSQPAPYAARSTMPGPQVAPAQQRPSSAPPALRPSAPGQRPSSAPGPQLAAQGGRPSQPARSTQPAPYGAPAQAMGPSPSPYLPPGGSPFANPQHGWGAPPAARAAAPGPNSHFAATVLQQPGPPPAHPFGEPVMQASTPVLLAPSFGPAQPSPSHSGFPPDATWTADRADLAAKPKRRWGLVLALAAVVGISAAGYVKRDMVSMLIAHATGTAAAPSRPAPVEDVQQGAAQATATGSAAPSVEPTAPVPSQPAAAAPVPEATPTPTPTVEAEKPAPEPAKGGDVELVKGSLKLAGGRLSKGAAVEALEAALVQVDECYDKALGKKPRLDGKLSLAFIVRPSGKVDRVQKSADTLKDSSTASCAVRALEHARFPKPKGSAARVKVALEFSK